MTSGSDALINYGVGQKFNLNKLFGQSSIIKKHKERSHQEVQGVICTSLSKQDTPGAVSRTQVPSTESIIEQARLSLPIHFKHGQTHEMRPASGNQGLCNEILSNAAIITLSSKQDSITELSNDT